MPIFNRMTGDMRLQLQSSLSQILMQHSPPKLLDLEVGRNEAKRLSKERSVIDLYISR